MDLHRQRILLLRPPGSPYYQTVQPGNFMTQADALQSGYQPELGDAWD